MSEHAQQIEGPIVLCIRDGWGVSPSPESTAEAEGNATLLGKTPVLDELLKTCPWALIGCSGQDVGLPPGQMGNSEVGHLNLGAGRVVYQDSMRISRSIEDGTFFEVPAFLDLIEKIKADGGRLHLMGLCSDGGVHSYLEHLYALVELARRHHVEVLIHCFMDGRDTSPVSGAGYLDDVRNKTFELGSGRIASVVGRYFAMDRDRRWDRVSQAHAAIVAGEGVLRDDPVEATKRWYAEGKTDEFIPPTVIGKDAADVAATRLRDGDGVVFFNFRADRAREITRALTDPDFSDFERPVFPRVHYVCMTEFDESFNLPIAFPAQTMVNILTHLLAQDETPQLRIAETEKYAHVTFFFSGGEEAQVPGEKRCLIPSPKVATYDLKPEMSAIEVADEVVCRIKSGEYRVIILNFANADMVGHTGIIEAAIKAIETVDACVGRVVEAVREMNGVTLITADHGNGEKMLDERGEPFTAHTINPVHFIYVGPDGGLKVREGGILADVSPTILELLGMPVPEEMTGTSLLVRA